MNKRLLIISIALLYFTACSSQKFPNAEERIQSTTKKLELDSLDSDQLVIRGDAYLELEKYDSALLDFNKAISIGFKHYFQESHAYTARGDIHFAQGEIDKAIIDYDKAIEVRPENDYTFLRRGIFKCKTGDPTACDDLEMAKKLGHFDDKALKECCE